MPNSGKLFLIAFACLCICSYLASAALPVLISDQGTDVKEKSNGAILPLGNLTIAIYDRSSDGNLLFTQTFPDAIVNGSWNVMISPRLDFGVMYWKDYTINGEDLDFDGDERIRFQSPLGMLNNISFINFSLINSCAEGSSLRSIYENGSVVCETDDLGSGGANLVDYALKNQSETFAGNITSETGFFGWLGDLTSRVTTLFVRNIDVSENVDVSGNVTASYFMGDGSLLTHLPAGNESDPIFVSQNSTLWAALGNKLAEIDQRYNETLLILSLNRTSAIMSLGFYNQSEVDALLTLVGNSTWNQSSADTLYYSLANPSHFLNQSSGQIFNESVLILTTNSSLWGYVGAHEEAWLSTYNATYAALGNASFNQSLTDTLYSSKVWNYNQTTPAFVYASSVNSTLTARINTISGGNMSFNQSLTDALYTAAEWGYNQTDLAIAEARTYTDSVNQSQSTWANATFAQKTATFTKTEIENSYYNKTETTALIPDVSNFYTQSQIDTNLSYYLLLVDQRYNETSYVDGRLLHYYNQSEVDALIPDTNAFYTKTQVDSNLTLYLLLTDQRFNETQLIHTLIDSVNTSLAIQSLGFYNRSEINSLLGTLNETPLVLTVNATLWSSISANTPLWTATFNATYHSWTYNQTSPALAYISAINSSLSTRIDSLPAGNSSFNQSLTGSLYAGVQWNYNQTSSANLYTDSKVTGLNKTHLSNFTDNLDYSTKNVNASIYSNSTTWWASVTGWTAGWFGNVNGNLEFNETRLNTSIAARALAYNETPQLNSLNASKLDISDQRYNDSAAVSSVNSSLSNYYLANNPFGYVNTTYNATYSAWAYNQTTSVLGQLATINATLNTRIDSFQQGNGTFNQTLTDSLYSSKVWNYNQTTPAIASSNSHTDAALSVNNASWLSTYNASYDAKVSGNGSWNQSLANTLYAPVSVTGDNSSWNQSLAQNLYLGATDQRYNETVLIVSSNASWSSTYNSSYASYSYNQTSGANSYTDSALAGQNASWLSTYNATYAANGNASWNETRATSLYAGIQWGYNQTNSAISAAYNGTLAFNASLGAYYPLVNSFNFLNATSISNITLARIGNCPVGQVVQNTTNGGVQCITPSTGTESDPSWSANLTLGVSSDVAPLASVTQSFGSLTKRWLKGWFQDIDVSRNLSVSGNVSATYYYGSLNESTFPTSTCSGSEKAIGIGTDGTVICAADETGSAEPSFVFAQEFVTSTIVDPLAAAAISSGTITALSGTGNHPGIVRLSDSGTSNGGYRMLTDATGFLLNGTENSTFVFKEVNSKTTTQYRFGFQDSTTVTAPTDGCWISVLNNVLQGQCKNNAGPTVTSTTYTISDSVWYTANMYVNAAATSVSFSLMNSTGLVWNSTVSANIPTVSGRETGWGIIATESSNDAAAEIVEIDYASLSMSRSIDRSGN